MSSVSTVDGSAVDIRTLAANEAIVRRGLATFVEVGEALMQIRNERQYQDAGFERFEDYLATRWDMSRPRAYQLIEAAEKAEAVSTKVDTAVQSERVARALPADPEQAREVWAATVEEHGPRPTAAQTAEVRERIAPKQTATEQKPPAAPRSKTPRPTQLPKDTSSWSANEIAGAKAIVANEATAQYGPNLLAWLARYDDGLQVFVDRGRWRNPFIADEDGDAREVVTLFATHYLPYKAMEPSVELRGRLLRYLPEAGAREHAEYLATVANEVPA